MSSCTVGGAGNRTGMADSTAVCRRIFVRCRRYMFEMHTYFTIGCGSGTGYRLPAVVAIAVALQAGLKPGTVAPSRACSPVALSGCAVVGICASSMLGYVGGRIAYNINIAVNVDSTTASSGNSTGMASVTSSGCSLMYCMAAGCRR